MTSDIQHLAKISYVSGNITVDIDLSRCKIRIEKAQQWLGDRVLEDCRAVMPFKTGSLQQRSYTDLGGRQVVFPGIYARFLYCGKVMVDPVTGSPWARRGAEKVVTDRPLKYLRAEATDHWFDTAKAMHCDYWINGVDRIIRGEKDV